MPTFSEQHPDGLPLGSYDVFYYVLRGGRLFARNACDSNVSAARVDRLTVESDEMAQAVCRSQPGGVTLFGSREVAQAWRRMPENATKPSPAAGKPWHVVKDGRFSVGTFATRLEAELVADAWTLPENIPARPTYEVMTGEEYRATFAR